MPLNYLDLQPKIRAYAQRAAAAFSKQETQLTELLEWLRACAETSQSEVVERCRQHNTTRCALPAGEAVNSTHPAPTQAAACLLLAADGSQIIPSTHDAVPLALINTSLISMNNRSSQPPQVSVVSEILETESDGVEIELLSEDLINLRRDVAEVQIIQAYQPTDDLPVIALRDGPLELFHQPQEGAIFKKAFSEYIELLTQLHEQDYSLAGYIDRSQSTTITQMLTIFKTGQPVPRERAALADKALMERLLAPGQRSAIFALQSTSSQHYREELAIHFFYLNVSAGDKPYIVRVEIPAWVAKDNGKVERLHATLLEQCRLLGKRPYPYLLHRSHEEAVVHFDEKEQLQLTLQTELLKQGVDIFQISNKLAAKELSNRTRM
jgi:hypothetical protein